MASDRWSFGCFILLLSLKYSFNIKSVRAIFSSINAVVCLSLCLLVGIYWSIIDASLSTVDDLSIHYIELRKTVQAEILLILDGAKLLIWLPNYWSEWEWIEYMQGGLMQINLVCLIEACRVDWFNSVDLLNDSFSYKSQK